MAAESHKPHIVFFPFMAHGHMIPVVDIAKIFASRNLKTTIITTPLNEPFISRQIGRNTKNLSFDIDIRILQFPTVEEESLQGCENIDFISSKHLDWEIMAKFLAATAMFQDPLEKLLTEIRPDCLVADMSFPWTTHSASKFGIPRLVFHGHCFFALCTSASIEHYKPHKKVSSDSELFVVPQLPGNIKLSANKVIKLDTVETETYISDMVRSSIESEVKSFGVIVNSFYELEQAYADHYRNVLGRRAWHIGPVSLCNRNMEDKVQRGKEPSIGEHECLKWLNSKKPNSVVYVCFGSVTNFKASQLKEIAVGLESSEKDFIWVVRENKDHGENSLPEGFEKRMEGKGLVIRGWAPQILILEHEAVGGFVTHCGWNSTLEGIAAGLPMVTWPIGSEQFYNEKLVTEVLKIGVSVGVEEWTMYGDCIVKSECVEKAVKQIMEEENGGEMRRRAQELGRMARNAVEEGGSSYCDVNDLINEIINFKSN